MDHEFQYYREAPPAPQVLDGNRNSATPLLSSENPTMRGLYEYPDPGGTNFMANLPPDMVTLIAKFLPYHDCHSFWSTCQQFNQNKEVEAHYLELAGNEIMKIGKLPNFYFSPFCIQKYNAVIEEIGPDPAFCLGGSGFVLAGIAGMCWGLGLISNWNIAAQLVLGGKIGLGLGLGTCSGTVAAYNVKTCTATPVENYANEQKKNYKVNLFTRIASKNPEFLEFLARTDPEIYDKAVESIPKPTGNPPNTYLENEYHEGDAEAIRLIPGGTRKLQNN